MVPALTRYEYLRLSSKRDSLIADAKSVLDRAKAENRALGGTEAKEYDRLVAEIDSVKRELDAADEQERRAHVESAAHLESLGGAQRLANGARRADGARSNIFSAIESRALGGGSGPGVHITPVEYAQPFFVDLLPSQSVGLGSGIVVIETERDTLHVPRVLADPAAAWVGEAGTITAADPNYDEIIATPRKLATRQVLSNELVADSNPKILDLLQLQIARAFGLKLDLGIFEGSGTAPEIRGMKNVVGIETVSMGTNGAALSNLDPFAEAIGKLAENNARASAIVLSPRTWRGLLKLKDQSSGSNKPLLDLQGGGANEIERRIYGVPVYLSSQLSTTEEQGENDDCSSVYVYQADRIVAVRRTDLRIEFDRSRLFDSDQSEVRAVMRIDCVFPNPKAICRIHGIRP
jgi:HK97 family phage major capsid protein